MPIPLAALALIPSVYQAGTGIVQGIKARQLANQPRPTMEIPESMRSATDIMQRLASQTELPGQARTEQRLASSTASAAAQAKQATDSPAAALGALADVYGQQQQAEADLAVLAAQNKQQNMINLAQQLGIQAGEEKNVWDYNIGQPYEQDMAAASALREAAIQNVGGGLRGAASGVSSALTQQQINDLFKTGDEISPEETGGVSGIAGFIPGTNIPRTSSQPLFGQQSQPSIGIYQGLQYQNLLSQAYNTGASQSPYTYSNSGLNPQNRGLLNSMIIGGAGSNLYNY